MHDLTSVLPQTGATAAEKEDIRKRRRALWNEVVVNLAYLPLTIHWYVNVPFVRFGRQSLDLHCGNNLSHTTSVGFCGSSQSLLCPAATFSRRLEDKVGLHRGCGVPSFPVWAGLCVRCQKHWLLEVWFLPPPTAENSL